MQSERSHHSLSTVSILGITDENRPTSHRFKRKPMRRLDNTVVQMYLPRTGVKPKAGEVGKRAPKTMTQPFPPENEKHHVGDIEFDPKVMHEQDIVEEDRRNGTGL